MRLLFVTAVLFYIAATEAFKPLPYTECSRKWVKVGCYHDSHSPRPLPELLVNDRDVDSSANDGHLINWYEWPQSMLSLACRCAEKTRQKGYRYFGLQFYGECWSGPNAAALFNKDGPSNKCLRQFEKPTKCNKKDPLSECIGQASTNYIYMLTENTPEPQSPDIDGGWSKWSEWTECSKTCGEGTTSRERACNNPTPKGNGKPCDGEVLETVDCHLKDCPARCKKVMDVGVIVDSSASVRRENFAKVKTFLEKLVAKMAIGPAQTRVGLIRYNHKAEMLWDFHSVNTHDLSALRKGINNMRFYPGGTRTDLALELANSDLFSAKGGERKNVPHVLFVITDGKTASNSKAYRLVLQPIAKKGIKVISMGIGHNIGYDELKSIALQEDENVFQLHSFDHLINRLNKIMEAFCTAKL